MQTRKIPRQKFTEVCAVCSFALFYKGVGKRGNVDSLVCFLNMAKQGNIL